MPYSFSVIRDEEERKKKRKKNKIDIFTFGFLNFEKVSGTLGTAFGTQ